MPEAVYKGYWMLTNRCNLDCRYCVLEDAPSQLRRELDLTGKKELVAHLYEQLRFRRLTLSGGEITIMGKKPPSDFVDLLRFLRRYRTADPYDRLEVELYTNGTMLNDAVADEMAGVVDLVGITIDSARDELLTRIGRNTGRFKSYFDRAVGACGLLSRRGIEVKLHSVVGALNHATLGAEVASILDAVEVAGARVQRWKFYQYMSYDDPLRDDTHAISPAAYARASDQIASALSGRGIELHFKDNEEMNASLFNILSYGNAQYMRAGDSWTTSQRTLDLRTYRSMAELFAAHEIDEVMFRRFHEICR